MNIQHHSGEIDSDLMTLLLTADPDKNAILSYIKSAEIIIALDSEKIIAVAAITKTDNEFELKNIAVASDYQGRGIAKSLIAASKDYAKESGATSLIVGTGNSSLSQLALYQKCGFRISHVIPDFFLEYDEPIFENGIRCLDLVMLRAEL
ncbi:MAG: GNAT family N-acetyltransferase [SAR86 cluster bacterium]|uniref:GNAT family N-acetyltransferase n=1 Tax=SAR86 cluster bacterium TaxID=2030880 RepID=A0A2A5ANC3_9GAMM|nr:MAG: GNAT family N-acetyltransferase [SAR86 cluster bacterium]